MLPLTSPWGRPMEQNHGYNYNYNDNAFYLYGLRLLSFCTKESLSDQLCPPYLITTSAAAISASPFAPAASPFAPAASPFAPAASPFAPAASPFAPVPVPAPVLIPKNRSIVFTLYPSFISVLCLEEDPKSPISQIHEKFISLKVQLSLRMNTWYSIWENIFHLVKEEPNYRLNSKFFKIWNIEHELDLKKFVDHFNPKEKRQKNYVHGIYSKEIREFITSILFPSKESVYQAFHFLSINYLKLFLLRNPSYPMHGVPYLEVLSMNVSKRNRQGTLFSLRMKKIGQQTEDEDNYFQVMIMSTFTIEKYHHILSSSTTADATENSKQQLKFVNELLEYSLDEQGKLSDREEWISLYYGPFMRRKDCFRRLFYDYCYHIVTTFSSQDDFFLLMKRPDITLSTSSRSTRGVKRKRD
jgi:hypothetical protein